MDAVNKEFSPFSDVTGALMDKHTKRIIVAIIVIILIVIAELVTHGPPVYEQPESPSEPSEDVLVVEPLVIPEIEKEAPKEPVVPPKPKPAPPPPAPVITGGKQEWLVASGIPESQWGYVDMIVTRESGWNPNAVNPSSGACGLGQQLPCGKWAGAWNDPVAALIAMNGYVNARYGSWAGAVAFWNANHWY